MSTLEERFWLKVRKTETCWLWTASNNHGYGTISAGTKKTGAKRIIKAHRLSWQIHNGEIPPGIHVLHKCDIPACVNPKHLFLGTASDNINDCVKKGRWNRPRGESALHSRLSNEQAQEIRKLCAEGQHNLSHIGRMYGVCSSSIKYIADGRRLA